MIHHLLNKTVTLERRALDGRGSLVTQESHGNIRAAIQGAQAYAERGQGERIDTDYVIYLDPEAPSINTANEADNWVVVHGGREYEVVAASEIYDEVSGSLHHYRLLSR